MYFDCYYYILVREYEKKRDVNSEEKISIWSTKWMKDARKLTKLENILSAKENLCISCIKKKKKLSKKKKNKKKIEKTAKNPSVE